MYVDMEFFDCTSQESTQLYYTKQVYKDGMLMKELRKIATSMHGEPEWYKDDSFDYEFLGFVSMNRTSGKGRLLWLDPLLYTLLKIVGR